MPIYQIRFMASDGSIRATERLVCINDAGALQRARSISGGYHAIDLCRDATVLQRISSRLGADAETSAAGERES